MIDKLVHWGEKQPSAPALIDGANTLSYGELLDGARASAAHLAALGVRPGDTVALPLGEWEVSAADELRWFYALQWLGAIALPLYPDQPAARRQEITALFGARQLDLRELGDRAPDAGATPERDTRPERALYYEYSSGTTGTPKVVLFTARARMTCLAAQIALFGWTAGDRLVPPLPWRTKVGLRNMARIHSAGGTFVNTPFPETRTELAELMNGTGVTCLCSTPWQLRRLLGSERVPGSAVLRFLDVNGAPFGAEEIREARESLTPHLHVNYGCSESGMIAHLPPGDPWSAAPKLMPGIRGEAVDETHRPLAPGEQGLLRFSAEWFPAQYAANPAATAERFLDGWFYPGDAGSVSADGRVMLGGRATDAINFGGVKIAPFEVEQVLEQFAGVTEAAVVGVPDAMAGEVPVAFVVLRAPIDEDALVRYCKARLNSSMIPPEILKLHRMPRNPEGKVLRDELRRIYRDYRARRPG